MPERDSCKNGAMKSSLSEVLVEILHRPVDETARWRTAVHVRDWIACCSVGTRTEAGHLLAGHAREQAEGPCTTFSSGTRSAEAAAFANGGLGSLLEMDDIHRTSIVHPGDVVIPAALAVAQLHGMTGIAFLDAIVRGYEAAIRIGTAAGPGHYRYWYNTATCGIFGSAAAISSLFGLGRDCTVDALGHAGMRAAGLWQCRHEPGYSKQLAAGRAAEGGIGAVGLARSGFSGPRHILEGEQGFFAAMAPQAMPERVVDTPDAPWLIFETSFKPWPACRHAHPVIELALLLRDQFTASTVDNVVIETYQSAVDFCDDENPDTAHRGRFSLQHCFAWTLISGAPGLEAFTPESLSDPNVKSLRRRIRVVASDAMTSQFPHRYPATVRVHLTDGVVLEEQVLTAKGDPENPMSENELDDKFRMLIAAAGHGDDVVNGIAAAIKALPSVDDLSGLGMALSPLADINDEPEGKYDETR